VSSSRRKHNKKKKEEKKKFADNTDAFVGAFFHFITTRPLAQYVLLRVAQGYHALKNIEYHSPPMIKFVINFFLFFIFNYVSKI
jgi:hypothetical protein